MATPRNIRPTGLDFFDEAEISLVDRAMRALHSNAPNDAKVIERLIAQLGAMNLQLAAMPSLRAPQSLGGERRDAQSLLDHLRSSDGLSGDIDLPWKGILQRTLLVAKIQFLRAFVKATNKAGWFDGESAQLSLQLREELAQSIYTLMAEELFLALLRKPTVAQSTKHRAAEELITIWDDAALEINDFCPLLESAWHARNRITPGLGTLLGATEYFRLVCEDCSDQFLEFFARDEVAPEENQAFAEFLFGLTWEELNALRVEMKNQGIENISEEWAAQFLGRPLEHDCDEQNKEQIDPVALYRSYQRRQLAADFRILADKPGPRRTAEAYLMVYLFEHTGAA